MCGSIDFLHLDIVGCVLLLLLLNLITWSSPCELCVCAFGVLLYYFQSSTQTQFLKFSECLIVNWLCHENRATKFMVHLRKMVTISTEEYLRNFHRGANERFSFKMREIWQGERVRTNKTKSVVFTGAFAMAKVYIWISQKCVQVRSLCTHSLFAMWCSYLFCSCFFLFQLLFAVRPASHTCIRL